MSALANFKAYFNAFDESVQQPKLPDGMVTTSAGLKAREKYVLKCNPDVLLPNDTSTPASGDVNVLIYFHPGLVQYMYVMAYKLNTDNRKVAGDFTDMKEWNILKVGNNGCPFKIYQDLVVFYDQDHAFGKVWYREVSGLRVKAGRVVSGAMRLYNVGLDQADVIEIKCDSRLKATEWCNIRHKGNWGTQTQENPDYLTGFMMSPFDYFHEPYLPSNQPFDIQHQWLWDGSPDLLNDVLNGNLSWENAPFHAVLPSGSVRGLQINAVPTRDDRPFREWKNPSSLGAGSLIPTGNNWYGYYAGFTQGIYEEQSMATWDNYCNRFYPTSEAQEIVDYVADPDFLGVWVNIIEPNPNLEILIECVVNYEVIVWPDSVYYTFQTFNEKMPVHIPDVRNAMEETFGTLYCWDVGTAKEVSKTIGSYLKDSKTYGATTGFVVNENNLSALRGDNQDSEMLYENFRPRIRPLEKSLVDPPGGGDDPPDHPVVRTPFRYPGEMREDMMEDDRPRKRRNLDLYNDATDILNDSYARRIKRRRVEDKKEEEGTFAALVPQDYFTGGASTVQRNRRALVPRALRVDGRPQRAHRRLKKRGKYRLRPELYNWDTSYFDPESRNFPRE